MIPAIHYFVLYYDLTVTMGHAYIWSFSVMGNGHCVADLEALILFTVRQAITYRYQF